MPKSSGCTRAGLSSRRSSAAERGGPASCILHSIDGGTRMHASHKLFMVLSGSALLLSSGAGGAVAQDTRPHRIVRERTGRVARAGEVREQARNVDDHAREALRLARTQVRRGDQRDQKFLDDV